MRGNMDKVVIVHRWSDIDPRCNKIIRGLLEDNFQVIFIGIKTENALVDNTLDVYCNRYKRILYTQKSNGRKDVLVNLLPFVFFVLKNIIIVKPKFVHCVNEEIAIIVEPLKKYFYQYLILDLFDSLYLRIRIKAKIIRNILYMLCNFVYNKADDIIVTDEKRKELIPSIYKYKVSVIYNTPDFLPKHEKNVNKNKVFKICVMGSIGKPKGIKQLLDAIEDLSDVEIIALGNLFDDYAKNEFINSDKVKYLGSFSNAESIEIAAKTDLIFAFYEPVSTNNIYASPNKLFEAMCLGIPILINSEVKMSEIVNEHHIGATCSYYDISDIRRIIMDFSKMNVEQKNTIRKNGQNLFINKFSWKESKKVLKDIYLSKR